MNLNKAFILGNVTRDPEVRSMPNGGQVTSFGIATNRFYTSSAGEKKQDVEFHNVVCFGKLADISAKYLNKGSMVFIEGRIKTRNWVNSAGAKQYKTEIIAETLQLGPKGSSAGSGGGGSSGGYSSNYGRSSAHAQDQEPPRQDEIPVIEENYTPPSNDSAADQKTVSLEDNAADEIDVKDIPF
ncbi:MAG: single-stranded DNA-binding protein [Candidatus Staskawiczbacteria bacterium]|nr:single-stranded DNA-binding protein [Candidatus Staskawiczbacteria bacterium]